MTFKYLTNRCKRCGDPHLEPETAAACWRLSECQRLCGTAPDITGEHHRTCPYVQIGERMSQ